jgi:nucleoside-diphosphate-sugar epimerase
MVMKALVMGGTGFIGRRLVSNLLKADCDVTIATSGRTANPFEKRVKTLVFDRFRMSIEDRISPDQKFDVLFDQLGFGPDDVGGICRIFRGKVEHYVFTSSGSVYEGWKAGFIEEDFDPTAMKPKEGGIRNLGYSEGKRSAEAYLFQNAPFTVAAARLPIVLGPDDSTDRFQFHVNRVNEQKLIVVPPGCGRRNYVWVEDAGRFLCWLGLGHRTGTYNAASSYSLDANELVRRVGLLLKKTPVVLREGEKEDITPYFVDGDWSLDATKAERDGFVFTPFEEWLPVIVRETVGSGGKRLNTIDYFHQLLAPTR